MITIARGLQAKTHISKIVFFRSVFALIFFLPWFWSIGSSGLQIRRFGIHMAGGITGVVAIFLLCGVLLFLAIGDIVAITFTEPLLASVGAVIFIVIIDMVDREKSDHQLLEKIPKNDATNNIFIARCGTWATVDDGFDGILGLHGGGGAIFYRGFPYL